MNAVDAAGVSRGMDDAFAMLLALSMAAQSPHEAAALVSLPTIHAYLTERGWTPGRSPAWTFGRGIVWSAPTGAEPDDDYGVVLPNREAILDYSRRVAEASLGVGVERVSLRHARSRRVALRSVADRHVSGGKMNHDWQRRGKYRGDQVQRCAACGASRVDVGNDGDFVLKYRRKGHVNWVDEEPPCGSKPAATPTASKNVSRAAVAEVAAELRKKADDVHADALAARDASNEYELTVCRARFAAYATAAEAIERVLK